ncbi:alpha/beta hydrolase [Mycobacterium cookii]|uniref:Peroxidase n=1 Tax=Mycobacterium cookii TaxID=1775 RepID=A0A7I7L4I3_9MYCO|nr:alpha/beta hydrolase [Mycobacterium cookii]MCV7329487.1 alpha/beta hydrolase [Mycobacterium cookii]BBX48678.1 peroxidase [Mycobacterium cookii]
MSTTTYRDTPTKTIDIGGTTFAYRELGTATGVPVIFLNHLAAVLDNWDPRVVDGIAAHRHVVAFDNRGVGASGGKAPDTIAAMARDAIAFISGLGFEQVDLLGFSLGGMVSQEIVKQQPQLVRKLILAGTGPAGGVGIDKVTRVTISDSTKALLTGKDPKENLFFTKTANGKAEAKRFVNRLKERSTDRDKSISISAFRMQLKAIHAWGVQQPADLSTVRQPVFVVNGDDDRMVPTSNSHDMARRFPNAQLKIYPDAGHGGIFQFHDEFVAQASEFLQ